MFGNVVNKARLSDLFEKHAISITGYDPKKMRAIHYPLSPVRVYERGSESAKGLISLTLKHDFRNDAEECPLAPNEYVVVEALEQIAMKKDGLVGHFVLPSHFIERGLALVAGRIESPYGQGGEAIRFGIKNMLDKQNRLLKKDKLAYVYFVDLLSLRNEAPYQQDEEEKRIAARWRRERMADSGVPSEHMDDE